MPLPKIQMIRPPQGGCYLSFVTDVGVSTALKAHGAYTPEHARLAAQVFAENGPLAGEDGVLVDIGAHIGTFAIPVCLATGCRVQAFEAQRVVSQILGANFVLSGIGTATVHNVMLGPPGIEAERFVPVIDYSKPGNFGAYTADEALLEKHVLRKMVLAGAREPARAATLDSFGLNNVFFVKLDVEGAELDVLKGSTETLARNKYPPLLFEAWIHEWYGAQRRLLTDFVEGLGYEITVSGENIFAQHRSRPALSAVVL